MAAQICETCKHKKDRCYCSMNSTCSKYEEENKRKIQYYNDIENRQWCYFVGGKSNPCGCGSNCYHHEYDGKIMYGVCNGCNRDIYEIKREYVEEELSNGVWK